MTSDRLQDSGVVEIEGANEYFGTGKEVDEMGCFNGGLSYSP